MGFRYRELAGDIGQTQIASAGGRRRRSTTRPRGSTCSARSSAPVAHRGSIAPCASGSWRRPSRRTTTRRRRSACSSSTPSHRRTARRKARAIWAQVRDIREHGVSEAELTRAKRVYEARWVRRLEDMEGQANYLAEWEALGDWELGDDYLRRALAVTTDDIQALARRFLDPDQGGDRVPPEGRRRGRGRCGVDAVAARRRAAGGRRADGASPVTVPAIVTGLRAEQRKAACTSSARRRGSRARAAEGGRDATPGCTRWAAAATSRRAGGADVAARARRAQGHARRSALQIAEEAELLGGTVTGAAGWRASAG